MTRRVFVTGGTGAIGRAIVRLFSENGYAVLFQFHMNEEEARALSKRYGAQSVSLNLLTDLVLPDGPFDVVINSAGMNVSTVPLEEVSIEDWQDTLHLNLSVPFLTCREYLPAMKSKRQGRIVNISSIYGLTSTERYSPYVASKFGLTGLTKTIARECGPFGVTCNQVCPGPIDSPMVDRLAKENAKHHDMSPEDFISEILEEIPSGRLATPEEIAKLVLFLASDDATYINGASIVADGGLTA